MFLSTESPSHSVRSTPHDGGELLIVGGESHKTGTGGDTTERYARLEDWARERFDVESVEYRWSAQDAMPLDGIPYVGRLSPAARHLWTASGFKKWGMTNGAAAAIMLADAITGDPNPWMQTFDANRFKPSPRARSCSRRRRASARTSSATGSAAPTCARSRSSRPARARSSRTTARPSPPSATRTGASAPSPPSARTCTAASSWNAAERSWDCPCHGSRFAPDGTVLQGPAVEPLERKGT